MSKRALLERLRSKAYRDAFVSDEIDVGLPMQIRSMRESRGWKQGEVAGKIGTKQPRFSVMESPGYGRFSLNTLRKIASIFDVGLIVSFVPFSEMIDFAESLGRKRLAIPSFSDECAGLAKRYNPPAKTSPTTQQSLNFSSNTEVPGVSRRSVTTTIVPARLAVYRPERSVPVELLSNPTYPYRNISS